MNITPAFIIVAVILFICALDGFRKGLLKVVFSILGIVLTLGIVSFITPYVSTYLTEHTQFYTVMEENSINVVKNTVQDGMMASAENQQQVLDESGLGLPAIAQNKIIENASSAIYGLMESSGIFEVLGKNVATVLFRIVVFVGCFIVVYILLKILFLILNAIVSLPGIRVVNKGAGFVMGIAKGILVIWIIFLILGIFSKTEWGTMAISSIAANEMTAYLYNNNLLLYLITSFL